MSFCFSFKSTQSLCFIPPSASGGCLVWLVSVSFQSEASSLISNHPGLKISLSFWQESDVTQLIIVHQSVIRIPGSYNVVSHRPCSHLSASKPKYTFDFSEEEDEEEADEEENADDEPPSSPARSFKDDFAFPGAKDRYNDHNDDNEDDDNDEAYTSPKQKAV